MQAVILAAGKGIRMGEATKNFPKVLLLYKNKTLLRWKLDALPDNIDEVTIVVGHGGDLIKNAVSGAHNGKRITFVEENEARGTGFALWKTKEVLGERFLVLMGDDIYSPESIREATKYPWSITVKKVNRDDNSSRVLLDDNAKFIDFVTADKYRELKSGGGFAFTGLYSLEKAIFKHPLAKMKTKDEWGLPQTLVQIAPDINLRILETNFWIPISTPSDLI
ncbi:hypothetical protein EPN83_00690 [Patescibacteria group bacterium]|nr:MAG: hypothetical protein EPN83_00690 [Patescibacteria group bacterium]